MKTNCYQVQNGEETSRMLPKAGQHIKNLSQIHQKRPKNLYLTPEAYILSAFKIIMELFCIKYIPKQVTMTRKSGV